MKFSPANAQHIGARAEQQDSFGFSDPADRSFASHAGIAAVVADGMGGLANGSAASSAAVQAFLKAYALKEAAERVPEALLRSMHSANEAVLSLGRHIGGRDNLGTTLAAVVLHEDWLYWISAGDSRVYFHREGRLVRLTADHVYAADLDEQVGKGRITREQAIAHPERESLTSYLGLETLPRVDRSLRGFPVKPGDCVLICSDGLYRALSDDEIAASFDKEAGGVCEVLVERAMAKQNAAQDNITVVALQCTEEKAVAPGLLRPLAVAAALIALIAGGFFFWRRSAPTVNQIAVNRPQIHAGQSAPARNGAASVTPEVSRTDRSAGTGSVSPRQAPTLPAPPTIAEFLAVPSRVKAGGAVKLSWRVEGTVGEVRMNGDKVQPLDSLTILHLQSTTTYTLSALGPGGQANTRDLQVSVTVSPPRIKLFTATPGSIAEGKFATLKWSVTDATAIRIDPAPGDAGLKLSGTRRVSPAVTTTYKLTATGDGDSAVASVSVKVGAAQKKTIDVAGAGESPVTTKVTTDTPQAALKIEMFQPSLEGEVWKLRWKVNGADRPGITLSIAPDIGPVPAVSPPEGLTIKPPAADRYTLTVTAPTGETDSLSVTLKPQPVPPQ